jgi:hypothetical protein
MAKKSKKQKIFGVMRMGIFRGAKMPLSGFMLMRIDSGVMRVRITPSGYGTQNSAFLKLRAFSGLKIHVVRSYLQNVTHVNRCDYG